jgi:pimeloyl-ACP methyl ester carboxylesterase
MRNKAILAIVVALLTMPVAACASPKAPSTTASGPFAVVADSASAAAPVPAAVSTSAAKGKDTVAWRACDPGFECGTLQVPMNWQEPAGEKITLALIRMPAANPQGTIFVNFGGPGAPGLTQLRALGEPIRKATGGRYTLVSWDPRGLHDSTPISCPEGSKEYYAADPTTKQGIDTMIAAVRKRAMACRQKYGDYLNYLGTTQGVHDLDAIRAAVGEDKMNFLGLSYGTRVGSVYAAVFPERVGRMVLDGSMDPTATAQSTGLDDAVAFEAALQEWFAMCTAASPCALGANPAAGLAALIGGIRKNPPKVPGTQKVLTAGLFNQVILAGIVNVGGTGKLALDLVADYLKTRNPTKIYEFTMLASGRDPVTEKFNNSQEIFQFVACQDWYDRPSAAQIHANAEAAAKLSPLAGAFSVAFGFLPNAGCAGPASGTPVPTDPDLAPTLVIGSTTDAETPLVWSQRLSSAMPNSHLLVVRNVGHTAFFDNSCAQQTAGKYFTTGTLPANGTVCPGD